MLKVRALVTWSPYPASFLSGSPRVGRRRSVGSAALHQEAYSGPLFAVDGDVDEGRDAYEVETARSHVTARDGDRLDRLVDRSRSDRLHLDPALAADDSGDRARDVDRLGGGRNFEHLYWSALRCHCWNPFKHVHDRLSGWTPPGLWRC